MKTIYTFLIALLALGTANAQFPVKDNWARALITTSADVNVLGTDTIHKTITVLQADSLVTANLSNSDFVIIDVRTHDEFIAGHIKNALNIDFYDSTFYDQIALLDRDKIYMVHCFAGSRGQPTYDSMILLKFREVYLMKSGFKKWKADGYDYVVDTNTNIFDDQLLTKIINIYPNPATEKVIIESNQSLNTGTISVFNFHGQELITLQINSNKSEINISHLQAGVYLLQLTTDKTISICRFIKQ